MIISTIKQFGLKLYADPEEIPFQHSANVQMQFIKDENYNDYTVVGYYIQPGENEAKLLSINDDGTFILGPDCFKQRGTLSFSFNLINSIEEVHLGSIDFEVRYSFGDGDTILPEPEEVWISLVTQVAKDAIREEVALVKQKANEALQSASLANDKASEAEEYANNANQSAGSASLSASSALTAKNDAIAASNQALGFSNNASESAIEAKNSADEALENANASNKAIETVNQIKTQIEDKANEFDTNYQEKQNAFNQSVTSANDLFDKKVVDANSDLDTKLQQANTTIDEKVKEATKQAEKATNEANRAEQALENKLDKNQGAENVGLTLVVGEDGNLKLGESTPKDVYTKEEVDYMLADKMDKPYVPIEITDSTTLNDCLAGNFKIDKIKGNTYQNVETDIVPTPNRPVPINSRKTLVTKTNPNMFNFKKENDTSSIPDTGTYRSIGQHQLKANTKYIFSWSEATVPAKATLSFQIQDDKGTVLVSPFTYFNLETTEKKETGKQVEFTTDSSGIVKFAYNCTVATSSTIETYQQYWYTKILKDISLKEDVEYEPEYVELRSLKETINKFDLGLLSQTNLITNSGAYRKIEIPIKLKPNIRYKFYYEKSMIPALTWSVLNIVDNTEKILATILNVKNTENNEVEKQAINLAFTSPNDGEIYFSYYVQSYNAEGILIPQTTETFKEKWFTKILKNIMITEESLNQTTYIPPTVRDYKLVDHTTQTSKIIRNVGVYKLSEVDHWSKQDNTSVYAVIPNLQNSSFLEWLITDKLETLSKLDKNYSIRNSFTNSWIVIRINETVGADEAKVKEWLLNNEVTLNYKLIEPTEEPITYVETDVSEVGYSWQDTTSPSPTIKSEVKGVDEIDILRTGKNLFDLEKAKNKENWIESTVQPGYIDFMIRVKKGVKYLFSYDNKLSTGIAFYAGIVNAEDITNTFITDWLYHRDVVNLIKNSVMFTTKGEYISLRVSSYGFNNMLENFKNIQLEVGDVATSYEPYQEQHVDITLQQPLYENDIANVESGEYEYNDVTYVLDDKTPKTIQFGTTREKTQVFQLSVIDIFNNNDIWCDKLKNDRNKDEELFTYQDGILYISIYKNRLETVDVAGFKKWLKDNPLTFVGSSSSPTTQPIPEEDLAKLKLLKTEQGVTNIFVSGEVKPTINARYPRDLALVQQQLEQKVLLMSENLTETQAKLLLQGGN